MEEGQKKVVVKNYLDRDNRRRDNDGCLDQMIAETVADIREAIPEVKNAIADKVNAAMAQDNQNARSIEHMVCATERNLSEGQRDIEKEVVKTQVEVKDAKCDIEKEIVQNRFEGLQSENRIIRQLDHETDMIKKDLWDFRSSVDHQFCEVKGEIKDSKQAILNHLFADKLDEKNDEIARLRAKCSRTEDTLNFSNQQNKLESMINSIAQEQKFQSKVSQFGIGNVALPTQTANQG